MQDQIEQLVSRLIAREVPPGAHRTAQLGIEGFYCVGNRYEDVGADVSAATRELWRMVRPSGTEAPGARMCGQVDVLDELRARVSS